MNEVTSVNRIQVKLDAGFGFEVSTVMHRITPVIPYGSNEARMSHAPKP